jgi:FkbM family methyltransferase
MGDRSDVGPVRWSGDLTSESQFAAILERLARSIARRVRGKLFLRTSDGKQSTRRKFFDELRTLSSFVVHNELMGGCLTADGQFYIRTYDGIYLYYNFSDERYTMGDGQGLDFRSANVPSALEDFLVKYLCDGMVYFDVGANNGYYYSFKVATRCKGCKVYCFEPDRMILHHLTRNIAYNRLDNIEVVSQALSNYVGKARMTSRLGASNFLLVNGSHSVPAVEVECTTMDDFVSRNDIPRVDFVKVDVEGGEYNLLKGGYSTLRKMTPVMVLELNDVLLRRSGASTQVVLSLLEELGYRCFRIKGSNDALAVPTCRMSIISESDLGWLETIA